MVFSSVTFIFFFLPLTIIIYYILPNKYKNWGLLAASFLFYIWGGISALPVIIFSITINYIGGRFVDWFVGKNNKKGAKASMIATVVLNILNLGYWKYTVFLVSTIVSFTKLPWAIPEIVLPIGISFYTFQGMSYVIDLYKGKCGVQRNYAKLALYIGLFPQLIAGPIVRYSDVETEIETRTHSIDQFTKGLRRFIIGLAKKAILANTLASIYSGIFGLESNQNTVAVAWLGAIAYALYVYFDFSGYSDMAIGLGLIFGFHFNENFQHPFVSTSISEIWRRWHISMSTWFRDYLFFPLGGSRDGNAYFNTFILFFIMGLWHGASWNMIIFGVYFGVLSCIERFFSKGAGAKLNIHFPKWTKYIITMFLWIIGNTIAEATSFWDTINYIRSMFGLIRLENVGFTLSWYLHKYEIFIILVAIVASMPWGKMLAEKVEGKLKPVIYTVIANVMSLMLFGLALVYLITGTYNPFLYFRF